VIVSLHVATGAAVGAAAGGRGRAALLGVLAHFLGDVVPHDDIPNRGFEIASGVSALALVAARRGPFSPETIGAAAASGPDVEHLLPLRRELFPSHRWERFHSGSGIPAAVQLAAAGTLLWLVLRER
jgi:hypothetical protein